MFSVKGPYSNKKGKNYAGILRDYTECLILYENLQNLHLLNTKAFSEILVNKQQSSHDPKRYILSFS